MTPTGRMPANLAPLPIGADLSAAECEVALDEFGRPANNVCRYDGEPCGGDCPAYNHCDAPKE